MKRLFLFLAIGCLLMSFGACTHGSKGDQAFWHVGTAACTWQSKDKTMTVIIAKDYVISDIVTLLLEKGVLK